MRSVKYKTSKGHIPGHFNESTFLSFKDKKGNHKVPLSNGSEDNLYVFREGELTFAVSINHRFPYVGLEVFGPDNSEKGYGKLGDIFLQGSEQVEETLGKNGCDKAPYWIASVLSEYCGL